jgi:hypothetical protein
MGSASAVTAMRSVAIRGAGGRGARAGERTSRTIRFCGIEDASVIIKEVVGEGEIIITANA